MTLPVPVATAVVIFFTMWWIVLFAVLPFGVQSQEEGGGPIVPGSEPGAPHAPRLLWKAVWTTIVSAVLFVGLMVFMRVYGA